MVVAEEVLATGLQRYAQDRARRHQPIKAHEEYVTTGTVPPGLPRSHPQPDQACSRDFHLKVARFGTASKLKRLFSRCKSVTGIPMPLQGVAGKSGADVLRLRDKNGRELYLKRLPGLETGRAGKILGAGVAAYKLSKLLGLDLVPPATLRKYEKRVYLCQQAVPSSFSQGSSLERGLKNMLEDDPGWLPALTEWSAFDYIGACRDRHFANVFFDPNGHQVKLIDHDSAFELILPRINSTLLSDVLPPSYTRRFIRAIRRLTFSKLQKKLGGMLCSELVELVWMRIHIVIADIERKENETASRGT